jgi:hypothetical protein
LKPLFLESDASDYAFGTVSFLNGKDELHLVAFHLRKFMAVEINYEIHDKELLAIVDSFKEWRHFLEEAIHSVIVSTEHKNLKYFMFAWVLNRHQARWSISLSRFNFMITYCPRSQQGQSDALSRHSYLALKEGDVTYDQQHSIFLKPEQLLLKTLKTMILVDPTFLKDIRVSLFSDLLALKFKQSCVDFRPQNGQIEIPYS